MSATASMTSTSKSTKGATTGNDQPRGEPRALEALRGVADRAGVTVAQAAIAWGLSRGDDIVPLIGARTRERLADALVAWQTGLASDALAAIEAAVPAEAVAGDRYDTHQMAQLDCER
jgi:aryl-alcohol dehydrogenase-like predicted oxidoreductase